MRCGACGKDERRQKVCADCREPICAGCEDIVHGLFEEHMLAPPVESVCVDCVSLRWASTYLDDLVAEVRANL